MPAEPSNGAQRGLCIRPANPALPRAASATPRRRYWKRHDLLAARRITDCQRAALLDFLDAHDALHRQMQHLRVPELLAQLLLGRIDHDAFALLEHELADLGEAPQCTAAD